jgi:hypothetical protein
MGFWYLVLYFLIFENTFTDLLFKDKIVDEQWAPIHEAIKAPEIVRELLRYCADVDVPVSPLLL